MKHLLLFLITICAVQGQAQDQILQQPEHSKVFLIEAWQGHYFKSDYSETLNKLRIEFCASKQGCEVVGQTRADQIESFQARLLQKLREYRKERANELDEGGLLGGLQQLNPEKIMTAMVGGSQNNTDLKVLDGMIQDIHVKGLRRFVQVSHKELTEMPPEIESTNMAFDLANVFTQVFPIMD